MKQHLCRNFAIATLAAAGLALGGCAAPAPEPPPAVTTPTDQAPSEAPEVTPFTLRVQTGPVLFEGLFLGIEDGYFEEEGLTIEHSFTNSAAELIPQVVNGAVDITSANGFAVMNAVMQGMPIKAFAGLSNTAPEPVTNGILVRADSGIESYGDLADKKIGLVDLRDSWEVGVREALAQADQDPNSVEFVRLPLPNLNEAVESGQVDAVYNTGVFWDMGVRAGLKHIGSPVYELLPGTPVGVWVTTDAFLQEHPDVIERFIRAWKKSVAAANADPDRVREIRLANTEADPDFVYRSPVVPFYEAIDEQGWVRAMEVAAEHGLLDGPAPSISDLVAPGAALR